MYNWFKSLILEPFGDFLNVCTLSAYYSMFSYCLFIHMVEVVDEDSFVTQLDLF